MLTNALRHVVAENVAWWTAALETPEQIHAATAVAEAAGRTLVNVCKGRYVLKYRTNNLNGDAL